MKQSISVCGKIGAGKSSILRALSAANGWDIISFGGYIKSLISDPNPVRETFQQLGQDLFASRGAQGLLDDAIRFRQPQSETQLFDGVRHVSVIDELRKLYPANLVVFLNIGDRQRYERFTRANAMTPQISYSEFLQMCAHPIELGIEEIASIGDVTVDASRDLASVLANVNNHLRSVGCN